MKKQNAAEIIEILSSLYEDKPALEFSTTFELLIAVILSAQCTDKRVNVVTGQLFGIANTPEQVISLGQEKLEGIIKSCGLYKSKAKNIISCCETLLTNFDGEVPGTQKELQTLAGVGKKTANVVFSVAFHGDAIAVDTHVFRVSNRLGLAYGKTPLEVEKGLNEILQKDMWSKSHHYIIYHGRNVCKSQSPNCRECRVSHLCEYKAKNL